jgi:hypothetical protein
MRAEKTKTECYEIELNPSKDRAYMHEGDNLEYVGKQYVFNQSMILNPGKKR